MKSKPPRSYESPLRRAKAEETCERILQALSEVVAGAGEGNVIFDVVARKAGVERRTVFRHFPSREALLNGFWEWINRRIVPQALPEKAEDLLRLPKVVFAGFDQNEAVIRASLRSPTGREMRLAALPERKEKFRQAILAALGEGAHPQLDKLEALAHLLYSASAWETLKDYCGMSGLEAGQTVSWALETLLGAAATSAAAPLEQRKENLMNTNVTVASPQKTTPFYVLGDQLRLLGSVDGRDLHVIEVTVPPGSGTPPHRHQSMEIFRVSAGEITFGIFGDGPPQIVKGGPGTVVTIPSLHGHNYTNSGTEPAAMTVVIEGQMRDFFEEVGSPTAPPPGPPSEAEIGRVMEACRRHGIEMLAP